MSAQQMAHGDALIAKPELKLRALREAVAKVAPSRLSEFFEEMQAAFERAEEAESFGPIRLFHIRWGVEVEIARHPETLRRLRTAEQAMNSDDADVRQTAVDEIGEIVRAAHREVEGG
ncbi:hypothetical protein [Streptomyces sp. NBC_01465]|uniref:hypothetical protein n=1 Tax=Streptomyces sp. NBC_01465 TaxID=2903878 RepID=UPI002E363CEF|nr:hypothetical protein [Streptomyces sp. NBC_01465]